MKGTQFHRMRRYQILVAMGWMLGLFGSACAATSTAPATPTPSAVTTPVPRTPGWEEYATPISVPQSLVSRIAIDYAWEGWGERQLTWVVEKTDDGYRTEQGETVDAVLVAALRGSLTNLRRSGGLKSCLDHTDDYPHFAVDLFFEDGSKATLLSDSNCPQNVPWNVVYDDELYVQYTGEIPAALRTLLGSLVADPEQKDIIGTPSDWRGFAFPIIGGELPSGVRETGFSEQELYLAILNESGLLAPLASTYEVGDLGLFCLAEPDNRDCAAVDGTVTLNARGGGLVIAVPVKFRDLEVCEVGLDTEEIQDIGEDIPRHALAQRVRELAPGAGLRISCSSVSRCDEGSHYPAVYASLGLSAPSECSLCTIRFGGWDVYHEFVYFPELDRIWVSALHYGVDKFQANRSALDMDNLLTFYRSPGHETILEEHMTDLEIQTCHRMMAFFEPGVLEANPDYVSSLGEASLRYGNRIDVYDYCVFVNAQGELEVNR